MYGVDQKAHGECLNNGGKTIAVLGWGIDWKVSDDDIEMYERCDKNKELKHHSIIFFYLSVGVCQ